VEVTKRLRRAVTATVIAGVVAVISSVTVYAAMDATLSSDHGRVGDWVLLLTDDHNETWNYAGLSSEGNQLIYLASVSGDPAAGCGGTGSGTIGHLEWRQNRAGLAFQVPTLQVGTYNLFMATRGQCWRIAGMVAGARGPLVLTIGTVAAENQDVAMNWTVESLGPPPQPRSQALVPLPLLPIIAGAILVAALLAASLILWRRRRLSG
jgi:hypothetical protein